MFRFRTSSRASDPGLSPHSRALAARLARRAAQGQSVSPAIFAGSAPSAFVCLYVERLGELRLVAHVAGPSGRREWRAPVSGEGEIGSWERIPEPVTRVTDLEAAFRLAIA